MPVETWHYTGQRPRDWPSWLSFQSWAHSPQSGLIVIHSFEASHRVFPGDRIERRPDGFLTIRTEVENEA